VSLPAASVGLDLDERVVRRHVSKLQGAAWFGRAPWIWGEGSVAWLTSGGTEAVGLGGLRPIKAPPSNTMTDHAVFVGWSAARLERRGRLWKSARELVVDSERWAARARCERGYTTVMPDLVGWVSDDRPIAVVAESGFRREDRQKWILEGWREAISNGLYAGVRYDCTSESVASWINRLAKKVWLAGPTFSAQVQSTAEQIAEMSAAAQSGPSTDETAEPPPSAQVRVDPRFPPVRQAPAPVSEPRWEPSTTPTPRTPEEEAEHERLVRDLLGLSGPKPRRRWRR
jgi:hypothetical protein